jgi:N6-adenosine-specific RNA methylase IME4
VTDQLQFHPLADIFPLMEGEEFEELVADIEANGLLETIVTYEGMILDGRNRYRALLAAGIIDEDLRARTELHGVLSGANYLAPLYFKRLDSEENFDPVAYVVSKNVHRRHLSESQRAMVAAKLATFSHGGDRSKSSIDDLTQADAAELLNVSKSSVERAAEVRDRGAPELQRAVERGDASVSAAVDISTLPADEQREVVAKGEKEILEKAKAIRAKKAEARRAERMKKINEASRKTAPLQSERRYPIIYADPPWKFQVHSGAGNDDAADQHYPAMPTEEICAMPIADVVTPAAALFMWTPACNVPDAMRVLDAWGFDYVTCAVWVKPKAGKLGHWVRTQHELLVIGRRGDMPTPLPADRPPSIINAPRREHSRKPDEAYEVIERMYPDLPRIELFARARRDGWDAWGNEAAGEAAA